MPKQSHYEGCPALRLLCNNWCGPRTKRFGDHCYKASIMLFNTLAPGWIQGFSEKNAWTHLALHRNISAPVRVTDLVKASKDMASLLVYTRKKFFAWGCRFFMSDIISGRLLGHRGPLCLALGANWSISLKFLLETKLQSKSFDTLDDLLGFQVQKLWSKLVKIFD